MKTGVLYFSLERKLMEMKQKDLCAILIKRIGDILQKNGNNEIKKTGLTFAQMAVLMALCEAHDKKLSLKELEKILRAAQSGTARIVMKLEDKGFVESFGDSSDKRIKYVRITPLGEQCCDDARPSMDACERNLLSSLTEEERLLFAAMLKKIIKNLE